MTIVPPRVNSVEVRGGRRGKGSALMTVRDISDVFKNISAKNKLLEHLTEGKKGSGGSPKRKFDSITSDIESPNKRNRFNSTRHFWLNLEGAKTVNNLVENNDVGARTPLESESEKKSSLWSM